MELHDLVVGRENDLREAGRRAFEEGQLIGACPHRSHTREADLWRRGFANAMFGAQMKQRP